MFPCVLPPDSCIGVAFILSDEVMTCDGGDNGVSAVEDACGGDDEFACRMAKHRGSQVLHRNDVRLAFEKRLKV